MSETVEIELLEVHKAPKAECADISSKASGSRSLLRPDPACLRNCKKRTRFAINADESSIPAGLPRRGPRTSTFRGNYLHAREPGARQPDKNRLKYFSKSDARKMSLILERDSLAKTQVRQDVTEWKCFVTNSPRCLLSA